MICFRGSFEDGGIRMIFFCGGSKYRSDLPSSQWIFEYAGLPPERHWERHRARIFLSSCSGSSNDNVEANSKTAKCSTNRDETLICVKNCTMVLIVIFSNYNNF